MLRRFWSLGVIVAVLCALFVPVQPLSAQATGYTVTLHLMTCNISGGLPSLTIDPVANPSGVGRNCVDGIADGSLITLDGAAGTVSGNDLTWTDVSGAVTFAGPGAAIEGEQRTIEADTELYATYFVSDLTPPAGPFTLTLEVWTCNMTGGLPSMDIAEVANESGVGRNCVEGADGIASILVDGVAGTVSGTSVSWTGLSGDIDITAQVAMVSGGQLTMQDDTTLKATFFISDLTPTPGTPGTVNIMIVKCETATGAPSWLGMGMPNGQGFDACTAGMVTEREWGLRVDGRGPDSYADNIATWSGLTNGTHVATTTSGARFEFTIQDNELLISALFGPQEAGSGAAGVTPTPGATVAVKSLPNTGTGSPGTSAVTGFVIMTLTIAAVAVCAIRVRRT